MARWTDIADWLGPIVNSGDGDGRPGEAEDRMAGHVGVVIHIAEGSYAGTIAWQRNPSAAVGSHFVLAKDGRRSQMIDTDERSWCQSAGNSTWISVENEGRGGEQLTPQQVENCARILARAHRDYGVPLQLSNSPTTPGLGWHGMGGAAWGGHYNCPGSPIKLQLPAIVARAKELTAPTTPVTTMAAAVADEEDDMAGGIPPTEIPADGIGSFTIWPVNTGAAGHGPAWLNICNDSGGADYALQLHVGMGDGKYQLLADRRVCKSGVRESFGLPDGAAMVRIKRMPVKDGAVPYAGHLTFAVEYARRAA